MQIFNIDVYRKFLNVIQVDFFIYTNKQDKKKGENKMIIM